MISSTDECNHACYIPILRPKPVQKRFYHCSFLPSYLTSGCCLLSLLVSLCRSNLRSLYRCHVPICSNLPVPSGNQQQNLIKCLPTFCSRIFCICDSFLFRPSTNASFLIALCLVCSFKIFGFTTTLYSYFILYWIP